MKEESHRVSEVCEKSVDKTTHRTTPRRLDGHSLYSAEHAEGPRELQADRRPLRPAARQLRRRRRPAEAGRRPLGADRAGDARAARPAAAGQDCPLAPRFGPAAGVRPGLLATPTATTSLGWSTIRSTSCCWIAIRSPARR